VNIGPIEDRLAIRELIEAFAAAAMRLDANALGATWAEEGVWKLVSIPEPMKGRDEIVAGFSKVTAYLEVMSMICFPAELVIEGDRARGKAYCRELIFTKAGEQKIVVGCYDDRYVKRDGQWYFLSRTYEVMGKR
jgi:ketosteroid isomerase-like protein